MICTAQQIFLDNSVKKNEMGGARDPMGTEEMHA
jgi:hypothetical protein